MNGTLWKSFGNGIVKGGPVAIMLAVLLFYFAPKYLDKVIDSFRTSIEHQNTLLKEQGDRREKAVEVMTQIIADNSKQIGIATEVIRRNDTTLERAERELSKRTP